MGAGGRRNGPYSPLSLGLLLPVSWRRWRSQRHSILSLIPNGAQNALVFGARRTPSEQEGVLRLGRRGRPSPARAGGLKPSPFPPSIGRCRNLASEAFRAQTSSPRSLPGLHPFPHPGVPGTPTRFSKPRFFSLGWRNGTLDSF